MDEMFRCLFFQALDAAAKAVKGAFDAAQKKLSDARNKVIQEKENCKRKMALKCDNCKKLKCAQAERNCKGWLDAAGKWIGGVVNAAGELPSLSSFIGLLKFWVLFQEPTLITKYFIARMNKGGNFLKKLWCCVDGRVKQGNLVLSIEFIMLICHCK